MKKHILLLSLITFIAVQDALAQTYYISTIAGNDTAGYSGDNGPATLAKLYNPINTVSDKHGNLYIADDKNNRVRKVDIHGIITTIAGTGTVGNTGDGGLATAAELNAPTALAFDDTGNLYICCYMACVVRKVNTSGIISTVAGAGYPPGFSGDGGLATSAKLGFPRGVAVDDSGNIYIADQPNDCVRKVTAKTGIINTIAGIGTSGAYTGDNGPATSAKLNYPTQVALDDTGNLYIADLMNNVIRKVNTKGIITTFAGNGIAGAPTNGASATATSLNQPTCVAVDKAGNVYIAEASSQQIRKVDTKGIITTIAGTGIAGHTGDCGPALLAEMSGAIGISVDTAGNLYVSEYSTNSDIRKLTFGNGAVPVAINSSAPSGGFNLCTGQSITLSASGGSSYYWAGTIDSTNAISATPARDTIFNLHVTNGACNKDTIINVTLAPNPTISVTPLSASFCVGTNPKLTASGATTYTWSPSTDLSATTGSAVNANPANTTTYTIIGTSAAGCTGTSTDVVTVLPQPTIAFNDTINNKTVSFTSDSATGGVTGYSWNFGDNSAVSTETNPVHTYDTLKTYYVCLTVQNNSNCSFTDCRYVDLANTGVQTISGQLSFQLYPNPAKNKLSVIGYSLLGSSLQITNLLGQTLITQIPSGNVNQLVIDVSSLSAGVYLLEMKSNEGMVVKKFVKE